MCSTQNSAQYMVNYRNASCLLLHKTFKKLLLESMVCHNNLLKERVGIYSFLLQMKELNLIEINLFPKIIR